MKLPRIRIFKESVNRSTAGNVAIFIILLLFAAFFLLPVIYVIMSAFKPLDEILIFPPRFFVRHPTTTNFTQLGIYVNDFWVPLSRYIFNSVFMTVLGVGGGLVFGSMAAYPLSKHKFPGKAVFNQIIVLSLLFSAAVTEVPRYIVMSVVGLIYTQWSIILPACGSTLGLYLMRNFIGQINNSMIEAARIDGCSEFGIYNKIIMPNVKPAWLTVLVLTFNTTWNNQGTTFIYTENLKGLANIITQLNSGGTARLGLAAAATLIMMLPPMIFFLFSQNMIVETMSTSGLKE